MNAQPSIINVPLSQLRLSPRNARKTGGHDIEGLAASIAAHNLLQNLTVTPGANDSEYEVVAGGRRLAALQLLRERGLLLDGYTVPCKVIQDDDVALEASTAENTLREAMHPADQFVAFKGMLDNGKSIEDVAAHFGVGVSIVRQRLKLANVNPQLIEIYRTGGMQLDQLQALALTDDHEVQRKAWFGVKEDWLRRAGEIRQRITKQEVGPDNPLVKFVGADLYEAAGGPIRRDLFSDAVYFADRTLLNTLAKNKIEALALEERNNGWAWVEAHLALDYSQQSAYQRSSFTPKLEKPTPAQLGRIEEIKQRIKEIEAIQDGGAAEFDDAIEDERCVLRAEQQQIQADCEAWPAEAKAKTGVLIYIDQYNGLQIERARFKPGHRESNAGSRTTGKGTGDKPKKATLSQDMVLRLEMHRAAAIREHIAADPAAALQLLLTQMLTALVTDSRAESLLHISPSNEHRQARALIDSKFSDVGKSTARQALDARVAGLKNSGLPTKASEIHAWIGTQSEARRLQLLALATALTLNTNSGSPGHALAKQFGVDMTKWWTPTPETFLGVVPKALLADAVSDVAGKAQGEAVLAMKKDAAIAEAAKQLHGSGWLPRPLRGSAYKVAGKNAVAKATDEKGKSAPLKKAATKTPAKKSGKPARKAAKKAVQK